MRVVAPGGVFVLAAAMAAMPLGPALLIPRHPTPGHSVLVPAPAE